MRSLKNLGMSCSIYDFCSTNAGNRLLPPQLERARDKRCRQTVASGTGENANWIEHLDLGNAFSVGLVSNGTDWPILQKYSFKVYQLGLT